MKDKLERRILPRLSKGQKGTFHKIWLRENINAHYKSIENRLPVVGVE